MTFSVKFLASNDATSEFLDSVATFPRKNVQNNDLSAPETNEIGKRDEAAATFSNWH